MRYRLISIALVPALGCLLLTGCASSGSPSTGNRAPTTTPKSTPTAPVTYGSPPANPTPADPSAEGWTRRGPSLVDQIQAAPSAPSTVYSCGPALTSSTGGNGGIGFGVSQDGGMTWQTWTTAIPASACLQLRVSPSAPQAVAVYTASCRAECGAGEFYLDYSLDGGRHWTLVYTSGDVGVSFGWVGTALFSQEVPSGTPGSTTEYLAVSKNGGPFAWTSLPYPGEVFSTATTIYVATGSGLYSSTDLGSSWSTVTPAYQGHGVNPSVMVPGAPMLGYDARSANGPNVYPLFSSNDGGATWQPLPSIPSGLQADTDAVEAPDGTIYQTCIGTDPSQTGIYKLVPGAGSWALFSALIPGGPHLYAVTWDASGHPITIWGLQDTSSYTSIPWAHAA
jgi:hypothetical protein